MAYTITKVDLWVTGLVDKPGALAEKLAALKEAKIPLEFLLARRDRPGTGLMFASPIKGAAQAKAAKKAGLAKPGDLHALRIEGPDKTGIGLAITQALAAAGINLRGFSGAAIGKKCALYLAFDDGESAAKTKSLLAKLLK